MWPRPVRTTVFPEWLQSAPPWLTLGVAVGTLVALVIAGVFAVGSRLFPTDPVDPSRRIDGETRRRVEIRDYLRAIDESFVEDRTLHGVAVAFYLPDRGVAITFDAQAYFRIERAGTRAVLCEYEMPARQLGRRLPFDVPEPEPTPPGGATGFDSDPVAAAFDRLDLPRSADADEVKDAYRTRVKRVHPDHGGGEAEFKRLREAYVTARDHAEARADANADVRRSRDGVEPRRPA